MFAAQARGCGPAQPTILAAPPQAQPPHAGAGAPPPPIVRHCRLSPPLPALRRACRSYKLLGRPAVGRRLRWRKSLSPELPRQPACAAGVPARQPAARPPEPPPMPLPLAAAGAPSPLMQGCCGASLQNACRVLKSTGASACCRGRECCWEQRTAGAVGGCGGRAAGGAPGAGDGSNIACCP